METLSTQPSHASLRALHAQVCKMTRAQQQALLATLPKATAATLAYEWRLWARDAQLAPPGADWTWWLILAGRGFGKTRSGAEFIRQKVAEGARRIALVGPTAADVRDTMVETGPGSILQNSPPWDRPDYEPSKRRLTWPNGAIATTFSADEPERFRGPGFDTAWCDELGAWKYASETWDMLEMGFREGNPQGVITTTPRPIPIIRALLREAEGEHAAIRVTRGRTLDNAANLAPKFLKRLLRKYEGTRLGLQELEALLLTDTPGALWTIDLLAANRVREVPDLARVAVAVDPQAADPHRKDADPDEDAETGIVAGGIDAKGDGYFLRDASGHYTPAEWGETAVLLHDELAADFIVAEINNGGAMVEFVVRTAAEKLHREKKRPSPHIVVRVVTASRGKLTRAEPIAALDEQGRIHHVGVHAKVEDQMTTWVPGQKSPDRMDARVWLFTALMLGPSAADSYNEIAAAVGEVLRRDAATSRRAVRDEDDDDEFRPRRA